MKLGPADAVIGAQSKGPLGEAERERVNPGSQKLQRGAFRELGEEQGSSSL
jgi:hypothetical protein